MLLRIDALADAPVRVQQVAEVREVDAELAGVALAPDVVEDVLGEAQVQLVHHRQEHPAALRVLAAVLAQVLVLIDVGLERLGLLGGRERAAVPAVNATKFISECRAGCRSGRCRRRRRSCRRRTRSWLLPMRARLSQNAEIVVAPKPKYGLVYDAGTKTRCPCDDGREAEARVVRIGRRLVAGHDEKPLSPDRSCSSRRRSCRRCAATGRATSASTPRTRCSRCGRCPGSSSRSRW